MSDNISFILLAVIGLIFLIDFILNSRKKSIDKSVEKFVKKESEKQSRFNPKSFFWIYPISFIFYVFAVVFTNSHTLDRNILDELFITTFFNVDKTEEINIQEFSDLIGKDINSAESVRPRISFNHIKTGNKYINEVSFQDITAYEFNGNTTIYIWLFQKLNPIKKSPDLKVFFKNQNIKKVKAYYINEYNRQLFKHTNNRLNYENLNPNNLYWNYDSYYYFNNPLADGIYYFLLSMLFFVAPFHLMFFLIVKFPIFFKNGINYVLKRKKNITLSILIITAIKIPIHYFFEKDTCDSAPNIGKVCVEFQDFFSAIFSFYMYVNRKNGEYFLRDTLDPRLDLFIYITIIYLIVVWFFNDKIKAR